MVGNATVTGYTDRRFFGDGGAATNAELSFPAGVAVDTIGNLFIADTDNERIRKVDTNGIITTVAGDGIKGYFDDGGGRYTLNWMNPMVWLWI